MDASANTASTTAQAEGAGRARSLAQTLFPYLLVLPTLALVFVFTILPSIRTVLDSLYKPGRRPSDPWEFVGLQNYLDLFDSAHHIGARFTTVLGNTLLFVILTAVICIPLALMFALMLNRKIRYLGVLRFGIFYPALLPLIGAASIWAFLYSDSIGLLNAILRSFGLGGVNWLGDPNTVMGSIILMNIWKQGGYYMIFYLAGLQSIPLDMYEAADLDGASYGQKLIYLTIPMLRRTTLFVLVIIVIFAFQTVEQLQALNQGNPADRGNLLLYFIFQNIGERRNWGYINAMTVILVGILLVFTVSQFMLFERGQDDD
ncbi:MAG: sugar ABC transporter permease [Anaerolineae bacterium]|nr:sugar ABC transporter permease [Anaerolineae bacterium]